MSSFYLSFPGEIIVEVKSNADLFFDKKTKTLCDAYIPGTNLIQTPKVPPTYKIEHIQSSDARLIRDKNSLTVYDNWNGEFPLDFYHLLYSILRVLWLERKLISIHGACVGKDEYVLIVGHTGVGKTSIILELLKDTQIRLLSGNKTIVSFTGSTMSSIAGTTTITASAEDIIKHSLKTLDILKYGNRGAVLLDDKFIGKPGRIKAIVLASLNDGAKENNLITKESALHKLYPYFLDTVNADTIMCGGQNVFVGTPPEGTEQWLAQSISKTVFETPVYSIKGSIDFVTGSIKQLCEN